MAWFGQFQSKSSTPGWGDAEIKSAEAESESSCDAITVTCFSIDFFSQQLCERVQVGCWNLFADHDLVGVRRSVVGVPFLESTRWLMSSG